MNSAEWSQDEVSGQSGGQVDRYQLPTGTKARMSFSGSERNSVFLRSDNGDFVNISGNSGLDSSSDGRCVAIIDFDRDGLNDFLFTNANKPTLAIFRNRIADLKPDSNFVAVQVVGGNTLNEPSTQFANRNGIGTLIRVTTDGRTRMREVRCGEGLATQNSSTLLFGLGKSSMADVIEVKWPGGKTSVIKNVEAGNKVLVHENPQQDGFDDEFQVNSYRSDATDSPAMVVERTNAVAATKFPVKLDDEEFEGRYLVVTAMATWCDSCRKHLPEVERIQQIFSDKLVVVAVPIDKDDTSAMLNEYVQRHHPLYRLLPPNESVAQAFAEFAASQLGNADVPFSAIVSPDGKVLKTTNGLPTISDLREVVDGP